MQCYTHRDASAIGICKHCQRGACEACAVLVGGCVACRGSCEGKVASINRIIDGAEPGKLTFGRVGRSYRAIGTWMGVCALGMLVPALLSGERLATILRGGALMFGLGAVVMFVQAHRWSEAKDD